MYITRFTTVTNKTEDYCYQSVEDAENHLALFLNDNSRLYRNICIYDEDRNTVLDILPFRDGLPQKHIADGSTVRIKPEWCSEGEEKYIFRVSNIHEQLEHVCITCLNSQLLIKPSEIVDLAMITPV